MPDGSESISLEGEPDNVQKSIGRIGTILAVVMLIAAITNYGSPRAAAEAEIYSQPLVVEPPASDGGFSVEVLINGVPAAEYAASGRRYIEAFEKRRVRIEDP
jgi:hypothetical protein